MKTGYCTFGNHAGCKGEIQGTFFEKCDCDCHVMKTGTRHNGDVMESEECPSPVCHCNMCVFLQKLADGSYKDNGPLDIK